MVEAGAVAVVAERHRTVRIELLVAANIHGLSTDPRDEPDCVGLCHLIRDQSRASRGIDVEWHERCHLWHADNITAATTYIRCAE